MREFYNPTRNIRGTRHAVECHKEYEGMPGFSPEYREEHVCDVVFNFPHDEEGVYVQFREGTHVLEAEDIEQIQRIITNGLEFYQSLLPLIPDEK